MDSAMQTCLNTLKFDHEFFVHKIATLDDDAARQRVGEDVNPIVWIAGHLLNSRVYLLGLFGEERELPFDSCFKDKYDPSASYPSLAEMKDAWVGVSEELFAKMEQASDDHFQKPIDWNLPNQDKTVRGAVLFYTYHEGWHLGQIAYVRKALGMEGLVPY
jgi:hypothetical protein